jgi:hypothetical protein
MMTISRWLVGFVALLTVSFTQGYASCCSDHGGVAQCHKARGYQLCKDKTTSATCQCQ